MNLFAEIRHLIIATLEQMVAQEALPATCLSVSLVRLLLCCGEQKHSLVGQDHILNILSFNIRKGYFLIVISIKRNMNQGMLNGNENSITAIIKTHNITRLTPKVLLKAFFEFPFAK